MKHTAQTKKVPANTGKRGGVIIVNTRKTRRNEKCPCGSEKKFKKCCADPY